LDIEYPAEVSVQLDHSSPRPLIVIVDPSGWVALSNLDAEGAACDTPTGMNKTANTRANPRATLGKLNVTYPL